MNINIVIPAYNAEKSLKKLLETIESQHVLDTKVDATSIGVSVVNDASNDATANILMQHTSTRLSFKHETNPRNMGRAQSINAGVKMQPADYILILDADCEIPDNNYLAKFLAAISKDRKLVFGAMKDIGEHFWAEYFNASQTSKSLTDPNSFSMTNVLIKRDLFESCDGFFPGYESYGFEDRDLILRVVTLIDPKTDMDYLNKAVLLHDTRESVHSYCTKQFSAGMRSSAVFRSRNLEEYRKTKYAEFDYDEVRSAKWLALEVLSFLEKPVRSGAQLLINSPAAPFPLKHFIVRVVTAIHYYQGTKQRANAN